MCHTVHPFTHIASLANVHCSCVIGLARGLRLLLHHPYWILPRYPGVALCLGDTSAVDLQAESCLILVNAPKEPQAPASSSVALFSPLPSSLSLLPELIPIVEHLQGSRVSYPLSDIHTPPRFQTSEKNYKR